MNNQEIYLFLKTLISINQDEFLTINMFSDYHKEFMYNNEYIRPSSKGYQLTEKGYLFIEAFSKPDNNIVIRYPMQSAGTIKDYNKTLDTSSKEAKNAIVCAITNTDSMRDVDPNVFRTFMQYILNKKYHKKMGRVLIEKWVNVLNESLEFFNNKENSAGK